MSIKTSIKEKQKFLGEKSMNIIWSDHFEDDIEFYVKKKKYTKILADIEPVISELQAGNLVGDKLDNIKTPENNIISE